MTTHQPSPTSLTPIVLAIDTSCDETSVAITCGLEIWSNIVASQIELHKPYGGVFPTVAKQAHLENILPTIKQALKRAKVDWQDIDQMMVTVGPGLAPALEVGIETAKKLAKQYNKPLMPANHINGHIWSGLALRPKKNSQSLAMASRKMQANQRSKQVLSKIKWPILSLVVSGGHTLLVQIAHQGQLKSFDQSSNNENFGEQNKAYKTSAQLLDRQPNLAVDSSNIILGQSIDDAAGEALDKIGRMLNLGYPAGPVVEILAKTGDPHSYIWPLPMTESRDLNLSFSGIKTYARNFLEQNWHGQPLSRNELADFCASLQYAVFRHICYKLNKFLQNNTAPISYLWLGGGVAANLTLRKMLRQTLKPFNIKLQTPYSKNLCGDNAAMIGVSLVETLSQ